MKRKVTNEDVAQVIDKCAKEISDEIERQTIIAESSMLRAERELIGSFNKEQLALYQQYLEERQRYYEVVFQKHKALK